MNPAPECDKVLLVQAELDGELDAAAAAELAVHRAACPICQTAAAELAAARAMMSSDLYEPAPAALRRHLLDRFGTARAVDPIGDSPDRGTWTRWRLRWWPPITGFGLGAACAAALALLLVAPGEATLGEQIVAGHIRALQPGHLEDVVSTDRHTVKPWFDGRVDFAPPVKDLAADRFPLRGGRLDYIAGRPVAALVYQRDKHLIDLFVWPEAASAAQPPAAAQRQGYNLVHWTDGGMALWAVSDLEASQLRDFAEAWRRSP